VESEEVTAYGANKKLFQFVFNKIHCATIQIDGASPLLRVA